MEDLVKAIMVRGKYNCMKLDDFADMCEKFFHIVISENDRHEFRWTGLSNTDLFNLCDGHDEEEGEFKLFEDNVT